MKNNIDFGQYEIMDRTSCIIDRLETDISNHFALTKKQRKKVSKALRLLSDVYQDAGIKVYDSLDNIG